MRAVLRSVYKWNLHATPRTAYHTTPRGVKRPALVPEISMNASLRRQYMPHETIVVMNAVVWYNDSLT